MTTETKKAHRQVPDRDSKYMGLAWIHASFSKDPYTQVGCVIVGDNNVPLGSGYNGPGPAVDDNSFSWERAPKDDPNAICKNDLMIHAEANAIDYTCEGKGMLDGSTLYCTAMPCPECMKRIGKNAIKKVVYMDYQSSKNSSLQNAAWREKSEYIAKMNKVKLEKFIGNLNWLPDWVAKMKDLGVFEM